MTETVSVIVAVYNGEKYLGECLESILAQTVLPTEIIVVDDGSSDRSAVIADSFGEAVTVLRQPNGGQASAIATGLARATGSCLAFNDADDLWTPKKLEWQLAALADGPKIDMVFGLSEQFVSPELSPDLQRRFAPRETTLAGHVLQAAVVRRRAFDRVGSVDASLQGAGFSDWLARAKLAGLVHSTVDQRVHLRRLHPDNYGRTHVDERDRNLLSVLRAHIREARTQSPEDRQTSKSETRD